MMLNTNISRSPYRSQYAINAVRKGRSGVLSAVKSFDMNPVFLMAVLLMVAVLLSFIHLMHFNRVATKGYELKKLEVSRQELKNQNDIRNMYLAKAKSLTVMIKSDQLAKMRKPAEVSFVFPDTVIARVD